jgi:hypothetical protein
MQLSLRYFHKEFNKLAFEIWKTLFKYETSVNSVLLDTEK